MAIINKYNLDYENSKQDIINHFKSIDRYKEWDFERNGSALNMLVDILSYNTAQNAFIANRTAGELFLSTCQKRPLAVSNAHTLGGYVPLSAQCSRVSLKVTIGSLQKGESLPEYIIIPSGHIFSSKDGSFNFYTKERHVLYPDSNGFATSDDVVAYEGKNTTFTGKILNNQLILSNRNTDTTTIIIFVNGKKCLQVGSEIDISELNPDTNCYFLKEDLDGRYQIDFGDGFFGREVKESDVVNVSYIVATNLENANGLSEFVTTPISGYSDIKVTALSKSHSGVGRETIDSIKRMAPLHFSAANRAVNKNDYKYLIEKNFSFVKSCSIWGAEENENRAFGRVYFSAIDHSNRDISLDQVNSIKDYIENYSVVGIGLEFVLVKIVSLYPVISVVIDPNKINFSEANARLAVQNSINQYSNSINGFKSEYSSTILQDMIQANLTGIKYIKIENRIIKNVSPGTNEFATSTIDFEMPLYNPFAGYNKDGDGILISSAILDPETGMSYFLNDDGYGNVRRYYNDPSFGHKVYVDTKQGTIDYITGKIKLVPFNGLNSGGAYSLRSVPAKDIIKSKGNTILKLTGQNAIIGIETNV